MRFNKQVRQKIVELLESGSRLSGLTLNFHDLSGEIPLPEKYEIHHHPACLMIKDQQQIHCANYCGGKLQQKLLKEQTLLIDTCPFGHGQFSTLIKNQGLAVGVLFAAPFWPKGVQSHEEQHSASLRKEMMTIHPNQQWISDRSTFLMSFAKGLEHLLSSYEVNQNTKTQSNRRITIIQFLTKHLYSPLSIEALAKSLHLSTSRTGHVIRELFDCTFPQLYLDLRLTEATRRLKREKLALGELAYTLGFSDQSHFNRVFKKKYNCSPQQWRKKHGVDV